MRKTRGLQIRAFSLIELMVAVAIIAILAVMAIPTYIQYTRRAKTAEVLGVLRKIHDGAVAYASSEHYSAGGMLPRTWPAAQAQTPFARTQCSFPGGKYPANSAVWATSSWMAVNFEIESAAYYDYGFTPNQSTNNLQLNDSLTVIGEGNLNCDSAYSQYLRIAVVDSLGNIYSTGVSITSEIE